MPVRAAWLLLALLGAGCRSTDVCRPVAGTCVALHVEGSGISTVDQLEVALGGDVTSAHKSTPSVPAREMLPVDVAISLGAGLSGKVTFDVRALVDGREVARGIGSTTIAGGAHGRVAVVVSATGDAGTPADVDLAGDGPGSTSAKQIGEPCGAGSECASSFCAEGVCCDSDCADACRACNVPSLVGTCSPTVAGAMPLPGHEGCGPDAPSTCGRDGTCDGKGACRSWPATTVCGGASCTAATNQFHAESRCDGHGSCVAAAGLDCAPFRCKSDGSACASSCGDSTDCAPPNVCTGSSCGPKSNGASCSSDGECKSAKCRDKVCCASDCSGPCVACNLSGNGTCSNVGATLPDPHGMCVAKAASTCATDGKCDGKGGCELHPMGTTCDDTDCNGSTLQAHVCDGVGACVPVLGTDCRPNDCKAGQCNTGECKSYTCHVVHGCASDCSCHMISNSCIGQCQCP